MLQKKSETSGKTAKSLLTLKMANLQDTKNLAFGPVPSRRLGKSVGINNIPPKTCSYSCIYCQLGKTTNLTVDRQAFYKPEDLSRAVKRKIYEATIKNEGINYLTFVPDGEPTLDRNIAKEIKFVKQTGIPTAVITNASLLWRDDVKKDLQKADLVSLKVDAVSEDLWRKINRPHKALRLSVVLEGIREFTEKFRGTVVSETMLMGNIDYKDEFERIAEFLTELKKLNKAYIAIPTRPPTEKWVKRPKEDVLNAAFQVFSEKLGANRVEYLIGYEGNSFAFSGNVEEDLLSTTAVHPMRKEVVEALLKKACTNLRVIEKLLEENKLIELEYEGNKYYLRKLPRK
jgi:wyosine [tRNA(Phe)-imidazoG37] synthetase (radical SAM superfamily)